MNCTITALFENRADAEKARDQLRSLEVSANSIEIHAQDAAGMDHQAARDGTGSHGKGFLGALKDLFLPQHDRDTYEEGVRRGHALLTVQVDDEDADTVTDVLEGMDAIDIDTRSQEWSNSGWQKPVASAQPPQTQPLQSGASAGAAMGGARMDTVDDGGEARIPIVEEQLVVGKRVVERGGARVRSYVAETPVHEQVRLREDRVSIERRPVDGAVANADALFQDREIEVTETAEEAVIGKQARVREELVVRKGSEERVEDIEDTVRHTEVEIDDHLASRSGSADGTEIPVRRPGN